MQVHILVCCYNSFKVEFSSLIDGFILVSKTKTVICNIWPTKQFLHMLHNFIIFVECQNVFCLYCVQSQKHWNLFNSVVNLDNKSDF